MKKYDNTLLVEFDFVVDLDLAMYKYIRFNYANSDYVDKKFISERKESDVIERLLNRQHINPLEIIMPSIDSTELYYEILNDDYEKLLSYATTYDTFFLMVTYLIQASSVDLKILCKNEMESEFIHKLNPDMPTIINPDKRSILLKPYTCLFLKYFVNVSQYSDVNGKHLFIPFAKFNTEEDAEYRGQKLDMLNVTLCKLYADTNLIHVIDLYKDIKFRYRRKDL